MVPYVQTNQLVNSNGNEFAWPVNPNGIPFQIPVSGTQIVGAFWRIPVVLGPRVIGYNYLVATTSVKPQADAIKVLSLKTTGDGGITSLMIAITDTDELPTTTPSSRFAFLANGLGGALPVMPTVTIPVPIMQQSYQSINNTTGAKTFVFAFPANPSGLLYQMNGVWFNGVAPSPAYVPAGITTVAGVAAYAVTNWSDFGTWTNPSTDILQLVSAPTDTIPVTKAGIDVELAPTNYCFNLTSYSTPAAVNGVKFGSGNIIPVPAFNLTDDPTVLLNILSPIMSSGTTFGTAIANKLNVNTVQGLPALYNAAVLVTASTAGVCA